MSALRESSFQGHSPLKRLAYVVVSLEALTMLLKMDGTRAFKIIGLPDDARLIRVNPYMWFFTNEIALVFESQSFSPVSEGHIIPELELTVHEFDLKGVGMDTVHTDPPSPEEQEILKKCVEANRRVFASRSERARLYQNLPKQASLCASEEVIDIESSTDDTSEKVNFREFL